MKDSLGDRMKGYEHAMRQTLPKRLPVIIRVDGRAFHGVTRNCQRPFDYGLIGIMNSVAIKLCEEIQGAVFAFTQSDEISILVHNYRKLESQAWFDNEVQKMVSVSASMASAEFTSHWNRPVAFDSRVFVLPEADVCNYFVWRQQDAIRNAIQMAARAVFSHAQVDHKNTSDMLQMLEAKGIKMDDYPNGCKYGRAIAKQPFDVEINNGHFTRSEWQVHETPVFTQARDFIEQHLRTEDEKREAAE